MSQQVVLDLELPADLQHLQLPAAVQERLQALLDRQDDGEPLTDRERREAEGLVDIAEFMSLLRLRLTKDPRSNGSD